MIIKGITIDLINYDKSGADGFNRPIYKELPPISVEDVLVGEPSADDITNALNMYGKKVRYTLAIPKGDAHTWEGDVIIWDNRYRIITEPTQGIEANIPLRWNKKVYVEDYINAEMESMD